MVNIRLWLESDLSQTQLEARLSESSSLKYEQLQKVLNFLHGAEAGTEATTMDFQIGVGDGASASGTLTVASNAAQSVTINGKTLTGGTDYVIATLTATQIATNIVAAISASSDSRLRAVLPSSSAGVVTISAREPGSIGNVYTLAATGAAAASGATMSGGTDPTVKRLAFNR